MQAYEAVAPLYGEYASKKSSYLNAVDDLVCSYIHKDQRLLDVGAGDGRRLRKIKDKTGIHDVIAIEPSANMAKLCRETAEVVVHEKFAEMIDTLDLGKFHVVTALWNVFGHVPENATRLKALTNIQQLLSEGGILILDVNNRHNALAYGKLKVLGRIIVDRLFFRESRGDAVYDWKIGQKTFKSKGHLFTSTEIETLFKAAGFRILKRLSINYSTGEISHSRYKGQLFYVLSKR
jgi:SAM-dependent methyltransferase